MRTKLRFSHHWFRIARNIHTLCILFRDLLLIKQPLFSFTEIAYSLLGDGLIRDIGKIPNQVLTAVGLQVE